MKVHRISLERLQAISLHRPKGYAEDFISRGRIEGTVLILDDADYQSLWRKYRTPVQPVAVDQWPLWAKALKQFAIPEDKGIGDVVARIIGEENSAAFSAWHLATFGKPCNCKGRQARWNKLYPLNQ